MWSFKNTRKEFLKKALNSKFSQKNVAQAEGFWVTCEISSILCNQLIWLRLLASFKSEAKTSLHSERCDAESLGHKTQQSSH